MRFKIIRKKSDKKCVRSGKAPALFTDNDAEDLINSGGLLYPTDDYEIVEVELTILET